MRFQVSPVSVLVGLFWTVEKGQMSMGGRMRTGHEVDPAADAHFFAGFHHLEGFVEEDFAGEGVVDDFDCAVGEGEAAAGAVFGHGDAAAEGEFEDDASAQGI